MSVGCSGAYDNNTTINASLVSNNRKAGIYVYGQNRYRSGYDHDGDGYTELPNLRNQMFGMRSLPAHGRPLEADARIPRHQRVPPRRKPARPAGARSQHHRADRSQHQRRVGGLRPLLARRPHAPPERLLGRAADHAQKLLRRHGRRRDRRRARKRPQSLRPHRRTDGHQRRAVPATVRTAAVSPLRTDARRGAQLRPHRRRDDRLRHAHESEGTHPQRRDPERVEGPQMEFFCSAAGSITTTWSTT